MATKGMAEFRADGENYTINDPNIANEFSASTAYAAGTYVNYQGDLWRFTADHAAGAWTGSDATKVKIGQDVSDLKSALYFVDNYEAQTIEYHTGTISSDGSINASATGYQYSDAIHLYKGDTIFIDGLKTIFRIRRYNFEPVIGTTVPNRLVQDECSFMKEDQNEEYAVLVWSKADAGENPKIVVCRASANAIPDASTSNKGLMSLGDKRAFDYAINIEEKQNVTYGTGTISLSTGAINPNNTGFQYSSAIHLKKDDVLHIKGYKEIYTVVRYDTNPIIGTTVPNARSIPPTTDHLTEDQESEYVVLVWAKAYSGENPDIMVFKTNIPDATTEARGLMSKKDKCTFDYVLDNGKEQTVTYGAGTVSVTNGNISPVPGFQYSSSIYLTKGEVIHLEEYKPIYRIARYDTEPTIGVTVPANRGIGYECDHFTEDHDSEYVVLIWAEAYSGTNPNIIVHSLDSIDSIPNATETVDGLMSKEDKQKLNGISGEVATPTSNGLMSKEDKAKLNNIVNPGTITIEGSGVTKNASAYGFLPTNTGEENSTALQTAVEGGGTILIDYPGVYDVCDTCVLESNTHLIFGANVFLNRVKDSNNKTAVYPFVNENAYTTNYDENISITGLHLITNGLGIGQNGTYIMGQRGQLAFANIKHLKIKDFEILDGTDLIDYNIHIQRFEDIVLENIKIISQKDGIHLGMGKQFVIRHAYFITNDDAIALNAIDTPYWSISGTSYLGWIENGIVEDIHIARNDNYRTGRGLFMLAGSWENWTSGHSYRTFGDYVVSNGRIYASAGEFVSPVIELTSTQQPTHESGVQTYSDGLSWYMMQDVDVGYNCGVRNTIFKDIFIGRSTDGAFTASMTNDPYFRSYYPGTTPPTVENIVLENLFCEDGQVYSIINSQSHIKNMRVRNVRYNMNQRMARFYNAFPNSLDQRSEVTFDGVYFELDSDNKNLFLMEGNATLTTRIINSLGNYGTVVPTVSSGVTLLSNDIGLS